MITDPQHGKPGPLLQFAQRGKQQKTAETPQEVQ